MKDRNAPAFHRSDSLECVASDLGIPNKFGLVLDNVLTERESKDLIQRAEKTGFVKAKTGFHQIVREDVRKCSRVIIDDGALADKLFQRVRSFLPESWAGRPLAQFNERLRFLKYVPGDFFTPHYDGSYERPDGSQKSFVTIQIYLNGSDSGDLSGGATTFIGEDGKVVHLFPKTGRAVVFEHEVFHEGSRVDAGVKYAIRTDVMYASPKASDKQLQARNLYKLANELEMQKKYTEAISYYKRAYALDPQLGR